jgi:TonB family protein
MEAFATYLLKSALWLTGFALVYLLFLRNERFFMLKRVYLLSGLIVSVVFPLIAVRYQVDIPAPQIDLTPVAGPPLSTPDQQSAPDKSTDFLLILMVLYISGVLFLAYRILRHAGSIVKIIKKENVTNEKNIRLIRSLHFPVSFSFFNYVFINPVIEAGEVKEIMNHEIVHVNQKHWFDLILAELLRIIQWINPFMWMYTEFIKVNHEYLADEAALRRTESPANYRAALINQLMASPVFNLTNSFNYSLSKKRFEMMKKIVTSPYRKMKVLLVLPVCAIIIWAFAVPEYNYITKAVNNDIEITTPELIKGIVKGLVINEENKPLAGANIVITGSYTGVTTDNNGKFTITDVPENSFLVVSFTGYKTQFIKADPDREMSIKLLKDPDYKEPVRIRSASTGDPRQNPLIVIDGVVSEKSMVEIDPQTIESVTVLKDPQSIEKYGEKGKNGVILVTTKKKSAETQADKGPEPFVVVEEMPMYPGGDGALLQFISDNAKYPEEAKAQNITGRVIVRFCVTTDGNVAQVSVLKGVHPDLDVEAIRVVRLLKGFEPGRQGGKAVPVWYMVPVSFGIDQSAAQAQTIVPAPSSTTELPPAASIPPQKSASGTEAYMMADERPQYPGGEAELLSFIAANTVYPAEAKSAGIQGRVVVRFIVTSEGNVTDIEVLKGVHPLLDAEAVRVIGSSTRWKPGILGGKPVNVFYMVPVTFTLK